MATIMSSLDFNIADLTWKYIQITVLSMENLPRQKSHHDVAVAGGCRAANIPQDIRTRTDDW